MTSIENPPSIFGSISNQTDDSKFILFSGNSQQVAAALFTESSRLYMANRVVRSVFLEESLSYSEVLELVKQAIRNGPCTVIFESMIDPRHLPLIEALLNRKFSVIAGIEAYSSKDAIENFHGMALGGWNPKTGEYLCAPSSRMASLAISNIEKQLGGIKVVALGLEDDQRAEAHHTDSDFETQDYPGLCVKYIHAQESSFLMPWNQ
jgi:hypothetical protein